MKFHLSLFMVVFTFVLIIFNIFTLNPLGGFINSALLIFWALMYQRDLNFKAKETKTLEELRERLSK